LFKSLGNIKGNFEALFETVRKPDSETVDRDEERVSSFESQYGWLHVSNQITGGSYVEREIMMKLPAIEVLTDIQYYKQKNEVEAFRNRPRG